jgi:D-glycero-alpha-D-manno-heptose 1-phosphate guanylyltransferase
MMEAIILAGGKGTRLQPVVADRPKVLSEVAGKPFLCYLVDYLLAEGVTRFIFSVGYLSEQIVSFLESSYPQLNYAIASEDHPLGTGGAIRRALHQAEAENIFIVNGDTFFKVDLAKFYQFHVSKNADCSIALKKLSDFDRYGAVDIDRNGAITAFEEKKYKQEGLINGGFFLINRHRCALILDQMPEVFSLEVHFLQAYQGKLGFYGYVSEGYFIDIGIPADYQLAQHQLPGELGGI